MDLRMSLILVLGIKRFTDHSIPIGKRRAFANLTLSETTAAEDTIAN